jgi:hypothetical protein
MLSLCNDYATLSFQATVRFHNSCENSPTFLSDGVDLLNFNPDYEFGLKPGLGALICSMLLPKLLTKIGFTIRSHY